MEDQFDPQEVMHRSVRRAFDDGVEEVYLGLFMLVMSALYLVYFSIPRGTSTSQAMGFIASTASYSVVLLLIALRKRLRARYVFPRTGYFVLRTCAWRMRLLGGMIALTAAFAGALILYKPVVLSFSSVAGLITSVVFAAALLWGGVLYQFPHLNSLAGLSLLVGSLTYVNRIGGTGSLWVVLVMGSALAVAGAVRFALFVQSHPVIEDRV